MIKHSTYIKVTKHKFLNNGSWIDLSSITPKLE